MYFFHIRFILFTVQKENDNKTSEQQPNSIYHEIEEIVNHVYDELKENDVNDTNHEVNHVINCEKIQQNENNLYLEPNCEEIQQNESDRYIKPNSVKMKQNESGRYIKPNSVKMEQNKKPHSDYIVL